MIEQYQYFQVYLRTLLYDIKDKGIMCESKHFKMTFDKQKKTSIHNVQIFYTVEIQPS